MQNKMTSRRQKTGFLSTMTNFGLILFVALASLGRPQTVVAQKNGDQVLKDALVTGIAMGLPGISVAIGAGDTIAWRGTAGYSDLLRRIPVKVNDRFCVGSITKTFVARVILQLVGEGKLDLDKTPTDYLNAKIIREIANTDKATLRQLLNHQSGIPTWEFQPDWIRKGRGDQMELGHIWGKTETLEYATKDLLDATNAPGQRFAYANTNYTILGLVIEAVTGNDAAAEIRRRILEPLDLKDTFLESFEKNPDGYVNHYHYATPTFERVAGVHRGFTEVRPYIVESTAANLSPEWTAGGIVSSASDLVRWAQSIRDGELVGEAMQREAFTYYPPKELPQGGGMYMQGISKTPNSYKELTAFGHGGGTLGFSATMQWFENTDIIVVMLTNVGGMHSGFQSPSSLFYRQVLLPAVMRYLGR
jgi:D-alanyl-D-alanine carboxypeptidase